MGGANAALGGRLVHALDRAASDLPETHGNGCRKANEDMAEKDERGRAIEWGETRTKRRDEEGGQPEMRILGIW